MKQLQHIGPQHTGLTMEVYRSGLTGDCTMGASVRTDTIWLANDVNWQPGQYVETIFKDPGHITRSQAENMGIPLFQVGIAGNRRHARPIQREGDETHPWFMFGGNFLYTSDSRACSHPIHIHDRTERSDGVCYAFYGAGDKPLDIGGFSDKAQFMRYIRHLAADLKASGEEATAQDFLNCVTWMRRRL